jgi:hypothetical protein
MNISQCLNANKSKMFNFKVNHKLYRVKYAEYYGNDDNVSISNDQLKGVSKIIYKIETSKYNTFN